MYLKIEFMKNFIIIIASCLCTSITMAQLAPISPPSTVYGDYNASAIEIKVAVQNTSGSNMNVKVRRDDVSVVPGSNNSFCWDKCYSPFVSVSESPLMILAGAINDTAFIADYLPGGNAGVSTVKYTFFDSDVPSTFVEMIVDFDATTTTVGLEEVSSKNKNRLLLASGNPAGNLMAFSYHLNRSANRGALIIHDILGNRVYEDALEPGDGIKLVTTDGFQQSIYFYSMVVDNSIVSTQKLIIAR